MLWMIKDAIRFWLLNKFGKVEPYDGDRFINIKLVRWWKLKAFIHERFYSTWCWQERSSGCGTSWDECSDRIQKQAKGIIV